MSVGDWGGLIGAVAGLGGLVVAIVQARNAAASASSSERAATESANAAKRAAAAAERTALAEEKQALLEQEERNRLASKWEVIKRTDGGRILVNRTGVMAHQMNLTAADGVRLMFGHEEPPIDLPDDGEFRFHAAAPPGVSRVAKVSWHIAKDCSDAPSTRSIKI